MWRRGVGTRLLHDLVELVTKSCRTMSLSCDPANPAMRLYERRGFVGCGESGTSVTMLKRL